MPHQSGVTLEALSLFSNTCTNDYDYQGGDPEKVRENQKKRFKDPASVDKIIELDNSWRQARYLLEISVWYLPEIFLQTELKFTPRLL